MKVSDEDIVKRCLEGDRNAFGLLVAKYQTMVYGLCYHMVGNFADAQDLAQETFIKAYIDLAKLRFPAKFASWINRITVNVCRMWLRSQKGSADLSLDLIDRSQEESVYSESPGENAETAELRLSIKEALASLSEKNRLIVTLYYMDGLSCSEIGDFLDLSKAAIKNRLLRARKQLKEGLISMVKDDFEKHKLPEDFAEKAVQEVMNHAGAGRFQVDTTNGEIQWLKTDNDGSKHFWRPEAASVGETGTYVPHENKSGAGLFLLNTTTGEAWWTNGRDSTKPIKGKPQEKAGEVGTYVPYRNDNGAGFFVLDTTTGQVWWTNGDDANSSGKPDEKPGKPGTYMPYENDVGGGFLIVNTKTRDAWWANSEDWGKVGRMGTLTAEERAERKNLLDTGEELFRNGKFAEAIRAHQEIYEKYSADSLYGHFSLIRIGICYTKLEKYQKAIEVMEKAVQEYPNITGSSHAARLYLGIAYAKAGRNQDALKAFRKCIKICEAEGKKPGDYPYKDALNYIMKLEN